LKTLDNGKLVSCSFVKLPAGKAGEFEVTMDTPDATSGAPLATHKFIYFMLKNGMTFNVFYTSTSEDTSLGAVQRESIKTLRIE
jgi:hypothetical protein